MERGRSSGRLRSCDTLVRVRVRACVFAFDWQLRREANSFLTQGTLAAIRGLLVQAVLGTDMANHANTMTR